MLDWNKYSAIAERFQHKAIAQDREDLKHNIILRLAEVAQNNGDTPLSEPTMYRIASLEVVHYWREHYKLTNGLDCHSCNKAQREKCHKDWLYGDCPKAFKVEYLSKPIADGEGHLTELGELIADDKALDLEAWLDAKVWLLGCPKRLVEIAHKRDKGIALDGKDREYLSQWRKREQVRLL